MARYKFYIVLHCILHVLVRKSWQADPVLVYVQPDSLQYRYTVSRFCHYRFLMKLFITKSIETVKYCREYFGFSLPSVLLTKTDLKSLDFVINKFYEAFSNE